MIVRHGVHARRRLRRRRSAVADRTRSASSSSCRSRTCSDILATPGVTMATHCTWFGGSYQNKPNQFAMFATDLEHVPEALSASSRCRPSSSKAALADRQGAIVGKDTATTLRLEGRRPHSDLAPTSGCRSRARPGSSTSTAIYDGDKTVDKTQFLFRYDYFDENRRGGKGNVSWYRRRRSTIRRNAAAIAADDRREVRELAGGNQDRAGEGRDRGLREADRRHRRDDHGDSRRSCSSSFCSSSANTMAQSVRERTSELAVLEDARLLRTD